MEIGTLIVVKLFIFIAWYSAIALGKSMGKAEMKQQQSQQPPVERVVK
jgi:hypothetical protein